MSVKKSMYTLMILMTAALWGLMGLWNRRLAGYGISPYSIVTIRNTGALIALTLVFAFTRRSVFRVSFRHLKYFFGAGVVSILLFSLCFFSCQQFCSLAVASTLVYIAPAIVVLLSAVIWKEPITRKKLLALALTLLGCMCATGLFSGGLEFSAKGILLGLLSGFFFALYSIFGRFALEHYEPMTVVYWTFVFCGLGALFFLRPSELAAASGEPGMWLYGGALAVLSTAVAYILYTRGLSHVEAGKAAIICCFEPIVSSIVGVAAFHESMSAMTLLGMLLVLCGVCILR